MTSACAPACCSAISTPWKENTAKRSSTGSGSRNRIFITSVRWPSASPMDSARWAMSFADVINRRDGVEAAEKYIIDWLRRTPNVHGLHKLLELNLIKAKDSARNDLLMLKGIIEELRTQHLGYACAECGFKGKALHWLCPGCNHWNTIKPVREE